MWCIGKINTQYKKRMYDLLDLYLEPYDSRFPVVGIDEKPKQLIGDSRKPIPIQPGKPEKYDYEYVRNGNANIFVMPLFSMSFTTVTIDGSVNSINAIRTS